MKLALGTAQFGIDYGVSNSRGKVQIDEVASILQEARTSGVEILDTAAAYGSSEETLGLLPESRDFNVISKFSVSDAMDFDALSVKAMFMRSLERLKQDAIYGLLLHNAQDLLGANADELFGLLCGFKKQGLVRKIGVSVYEPTQALAIVERYDIDIIQLPLSIFDQRFLQNNLLEKVKQRGVEIHARSLFLQGALLMEPGALPSFLQTLSPKLKEIDDLSRMLVLSKLSILLGFVAQIPWVDFSVLGVTSVVELRELVVAFQEASVSFEGVDWGRFAVDDEALILPSRWVVA